jgi:hypothetical protein
VTPVSPPTDDIQASQESSGNGCVAEEIVTSSNTSVDVGLPIAASSSAVQDISVEINGPDVQAGAQLGVEVLEVVQVSSVGAEAQNNQSESQLVIENDQQREKTPLIESDDEDEDVPRISRKIELQSAFLQNLSAASSAGAETGVSDGVPSAVGVASVSSSDMAAVLAADEGDVIIGIETGFPLIAAPGSSVFEIETIQSSSG